MFPMGSPGQLAGVVLLNPTLAGVAKPDKHSAVGGGAVRNLRKYRSSFCDSCPQRLDVTSREGLFQSCLSLQCLHLSVLCSYCSSVLTLPDLPIVLLSRSISLFLQGMTFHQPVRSPLRCRFMNGKHDLLQMAFWNLLQLVLEAFQLNDPGPHVVVELNQDSLHPIQSLMPNETSQRDLLPWFETARWSGDFSCFAQDTCLEEGQLGRLWLLGGTRQSELAAAQNGF
mmetsp:Transcript_87931/g.192892  ORF Transcript_87931/g.192892 Transcript_87931/m.192892 type:complete len:227 (-) Transcript_87931:38-718(-)